MTIVATIYAYLVTPVYEAKAFIQIGQVGQVSQTGQVSIIQLEDIGLLKQKLDIAFEIKKPNNKITQKNGIVSEAKILKKSANILQINTHAYSNELAIAKCKEVLKYINNEYKEKFSQGTQKLDSQIKLNEEMIKNLKKSTINPKKMEEFSTKYSSMLSFIEFEVGLKGIATLKKDELMLKTQNHLEELREAKSSSNSFQSKILDKIITNDFAIKPKKKLIVVVAFMTGFILSIFLVFFLGFLKSLKKEDKK